MKSMFTPLLTLSMALTLGLSACGDNKNAAAEAACVETTKKLSDELTKAHGDLAKANTEKGEIQGKLDAALAEVKALKEKLQATEKAMPAPAADAVKSEATSEPAKPAEPAKAEPAKEEKK